MRRRYKLLAALIALPALLALVATVVLPILADSVHYKRQVVALVKKHTGHDLHIDGKVRLHLFPRLGLTITDIRLANPPGFGGSDLARLPWLAVDVKALPLLSGRIEPGAIVVSGPIVNLERDQHGRGNWETIKSVGKDGAWEQGTGADTPLAAMAVGELTIRDATLHWRDRANGETFTLPAINVQTGALHGGKGIDDVRLQLRLPGSDATIDARGDATLSAAGDTVVIPELTTSFQRLTFAGMPMTGTLSTRLTADFAERRLILDTLRVSARGSRGEERQVAVAIAARLDVDLARQRLTESTVSATVPAYSLSGIGGDLELTGILSGDLRSGIYTLDSMQGNGTMGGEAMAGSSAAFSLSGALRADLQRWTFFALGLEVAGSVDGDRAPFRLMTDLDMSPRTQTLAATAMQLSVRDWRIDGAMTLHGAGSPAGVEGVLDLQVQNRAVAGSFGITESEAEAGAFDVRFDVVADFDIEGSGDAPLGRNALVLRAKVERGSVQGAWQIGDLHLGARLADSHFPDGELTIAMQADVAVNLNDESVRSDNLRLSVDDSRIVGSVDVQRFDKPEVRIDLQADTIDADRYLLPIAASAGNAAAATPVSAFIDGIRALDLTGGLHVQKLTLRGMQLKDVRVTSGGAVSGG